MLAVGGIGAAVGTWIILPVDTLLAQFTPLREGGSSFALKTLSAEPLSPRVNFHQLAEVLSEGRTVPVVGVLRGNAALSALNVGLFGVIASQVFRRWWVPFVVAWAVHVNPLSVIAKQSELPGQLVTTYVCLGVMCYAALDSKLSASLRWLALGGLAILTFLAVQTRIELGIVAVPALFFGLTRVVLGDEQLERRAERLHKRLRSAVAALAKRPAWTIGIVVAAIVLTVTIGRRDQYLGFALAALNPFEIVWLTYPIWLAMVLPVGATGLIVFGWFYAVKSWWRFAGLPLTVLCLFKAYWAACHEGTAVFEMLRYQVLLNPMAMLLGLFGWRQLDHTRERYWPALRPEWVVVVVGLSSLIVFRGLLGVTVRRSRSLALLADRPPSAMIERNFQREVRFLAEARRRYPQCRILVPVAKRQRSHTRGMAAFGFKGYESFEERRFNREFEAKDLADLRAKHPAAFKGCVLLYRGLDCHIARTDFCQRDPMSGKPVMQTRFAADAYGEPMEWGPYLGMIELTLHRITAETP